MDVGDPSCAGMVITVKSSVGRFTDPPFRWTDDIMSVGEVTSFRQHKILVFISNDLRTPLCISVDVHQLKQGSLKTTINDNNYLEINRGFSTYTLNAKHSISCT